MTDARQNYVNLVAGLTRTTRDRAQATARVLLAQAGLTDVAHDAGERVSKLAEEIVNAGRANRELMENLIAAEVDKAATRLGFARAEDVQALREEIAELRGSLYEARASAAKRPSPATRPRKTTTSTAPAAVKAAAKPAAARKNSATAAPKKSAASASKEPAAAAGKKPASDA